MVIETFEQVKRVHFVGIGGAGMSALAHLVMRRGIQVSGSDILESEITQRLAGEGAEVTIGHSAELIEDADWLIISDAIGPKNPELVAAKEKGLSIWRRSELLGWVTKQYQSIAIAGTHGKTTTTAILGQMLIEAKTDPTILVGGDIPGFSGNARVGGGKVLVTEACEAYNGFIDLWPHIGVITNIEADHLDFHGTEEQLRRNFMAYARLLPTDGLLILHQDDPATKEMAASVNCNIHTFGLNGSGHFTATDIQLDPKETRFKVQENGNLIGEFAMRLPGIHNVLNAMAAITVGLVMGLPVEDLKRGLAGFGGVQRRLEFLEEIDGIIVMDDYAHHPTEVRASLAALRQNYPDNRIIAIFQPHLYSRTRDFLHGFVESLLAADEVVVTDIYPAREEPIPGISSSLIAEEFHALRTGKKCDYIPDRHKIAGTILPHLRSGDLVMTIGAGNVVDAAHDLLKLLHERKMKATRPLRVAVLMGGDSSEREISLSTGRMVLGALNPERFEAFGVDPSQLLIDKGSVRGLVDFITNEKPDVAFIALHGVRGEDGCIQGLLEIVGIPYTGPGVLASAVAMDKRLTKDVLTAAGVLVPKGVAVTRSEGASDEILKTINATLKYPLIAKPNAEGSTIGVTRIYKPEELADGIKHAHSYDDLALVEELIEGVEISAAVLGNEVVEVLPLVEIVPTSGFYDFTAKYTPGATDEICPARLPEDRAEEASEIAKRTYKTLGCRGFARVDMIVTPDRIVVLEANTVPGMTATSLFPRCAKVAGIEFPDLLARIINLALEGKR